MWGLGQSPNKEVKKLRLEKYNFQTEATNKLRKAVARSLKAYISNNDSEHNYIISLQAPTGAGKTIIMASLIEDIFFGSTINDGKEIPDIFDAQYNAIFVWLSDSPALNLQSKAKIELNANKIPAGRCKVIEENNFNQEYLDEGYIYFLNTQKLSKSGNLGKHGDNRSWTLWETLENTARDKADRFYFIIDEAHRGAKEREAGKQTTIMQRFIKGYKEENMRPMPIVIGISATAERFNKLIKDKSNHTVEEIYVPVQKVKGSGLLKDKIKVIYPENEKMDYMGVVQPATEEWINKCNHWREFSSNYHKKNVDPVFLVQVENGEGKTVSNTDLNAVLSTIEDKAGKFHENEVVHAFGSVGDITINGLKVHSVAPESIEENHNIKLVFFKEALSTGWDCPRAETMLSFRPADDATYIAQLLGRMIRTPLGARVTVDDTLNEVRLYAPRFNKEKVEKIIEVFKSAEGEELPADIEAESTAKPTRVWTANPKKVDPNQIPLFPDTKPPTERDIEPQEPETQPEVPPFVNSPITSPTIPQMPEKSTIPEVKLKPEQIPLLPEINRKEILDFINKKGYLSYTVKDTQINDFLKSLMDLASLFTIHGIYPKANNEIEAEITEMIHNYAENLRKFGRYESMKSDISAGRLVIEVFDVFGEEIKFSSQTELFMSEKIIDRQAELANERLGSHGYVNSYMRRYEKELGHSNCKVDCILFAAENDCLKELFEYAKKKFHYFNDNYRKYVSDKGEEVKKQYNKIISAGDKVSKTLLTLPEKIDNRTNEHDKKYYDHFYVDEEKGYANIKLNSWEEHTIEEERERRDYICFIRNTAKANWALKIPYKIDNQDKAMYPDFLIVRSEPQSKYVIDILEPHSEIFADSLAKAKGMAFYAENEEKIDRAQMIREEKDKATGKNVLRRLDLGKGEIREAVKNAISVEDFENIFKKYGVVEH